MLNDKQDIEFIRTRMKDKPIFIADGHHRYDTALNYRNERRKADSLRERDQPYNYVAMYLARLEDPGLTVLPAHRALFNLPGFDYKRFEEDLNLYFNIERIDFDRRSESRRPANGPGDDGPSSGPCARIRHAGQGGEKLLHSDAEK